MSPRNFFLTFLATVVLGVAAAAFLYFNSFFTFQQLSCNNGAGLCPDFVSAELESYRGRSVFFTDLEPLKKTITQNTPSIETVSLKKTLPNQLAMTITTTRPVYTLVDSSNSPWIIDSRGFVKELATDTMQPRIGVAPSFSFFLEKGDKLPDELHQNLLEIIPELQREPFLGTKSFLLGERELELQFSDGKKAYIRVSEHALDLERLQYILEHKDAKTFSSAVTEIDLRYGQIIVRTASDSGKTAPKN